MDARTAESRLTSRAERWLQQERESGRFYDLVALAVGLGLALALILRPPPDEACADATPAASEPLR